jgi:hypothetical protein
MPVNLPDFTRSITQGPSGIMPARLQNVRYEEQLKRYESGRELSLIMKQAHDAITLAENNKHVGQAATELAKSITTA